MRKNDQNELLYMYQCMDTKVFEINVDSRTAKATWDTLVRCFGGDTSVKKVKLQFLCKQYDNLSMKNNGNIPNYISRVIAVNNEMKSCGEVLFEQVIIEKTRISLTPWFHYIVVAI